MQIQSRCTQISVKNGAGRERVPDGRAAAGKQAGHNPKGGYMCGDNQSCYRAFLLCMKQVYYTATSSSAAAIRASSSRGGRGRAGGGAGPHTHKLRLIVGQELLSTK